MAKLVERPTWEEFQELAGVTGKEKPISGTVIKQAQKATKVDRLPPSYLEYFAFCGGVREWKITKARERFPRFLIIASPKYLRDFRNTYMLRLKSSESDAMERPVAEQVRDLIPFGKDADRMTLCWDPQKVGEDDELGICLIDRSRSWKSLRDARVDVGTHLLDVLKYFKPRT